MVKSQPVIYSKLTSTERQKLEEERKRQERRYKDRLRQSLLEFMGTKPTSPPPAMTLATASSAQGEQTEKE
jgi:hypothetical protein